MFGFIKTVFVVAMAFFSGNAIECVSMIKWECKIRPQVVNINSNNPCFYPYSTKTNKCSGSRSNINDSYSKLYLPNVVKNKRQSI